VGDRDELGRAKYAAFTGAVQLRGAMFGKDACLVRRDTWAHDDLAGPMRTRIKNALIVGLTVLAIALWMAAYWYEAGRQVEAWEKAQEFNDFDRWASTLLWSPLLAAWEQLSSAEWEGGFRAAFYLRTTIELQTEWQIF
jgi:hypothetical protein